MSVAQRLGECGPVAGLPDGDAWERWCRRWWTFMSRSRARLMTTPDYATLEAHIATELVMLLPVLELEPRAMADLQERGATTLFTPQRGG